LDFKDTSFLIERAFQLPIIMDVKSTLPRLPTQNVRTSEEKFPQLPERKKRGSQHQP